MNLVYEIVFIISAILIMRYDWNTKTIPVIFVLLNYSAICMTINPYLLVGNVAILILQKLEKSIDMIYICLLGYIFISYQNPYLAICVIPLILQVILSKEKIMSFMVSIELSYIVFFILKMLILP